MRSARRHVAALAAAHGLALAAHAQPDCGRLRRELDPVTVALRVNNDLFGGFGQDQGYSNGLALTLTSPNVANYVDDPCLPELARKLNRYLKGIFPHGVDEQNMTLEIDHALYTPSDKARTDLIAGDRPYAAVLTLALGYNARSGGQLRTSQIRVGIVGPSAHGRQLQNGWHKVIGVTPFDGWAHQLHDEPVLQLAHERRRKEATERLADGWAWDATSHWGGSLGNATTHFNAGMEWRLGVGLPDDFGSAPLRPAGENTSPSPLRAADAGWSGHGFLTFNARWVLRDITLDGNTIRDSHRVDKMPVVADLGYGVALTRGPWKLAFARYHRTREFRGQSEVPVFGSFTIARRY